MHSVQRAHIDLLWDELHESAARPDALLTWLSPGEQQRAASFQSNFRRIRYICARSVVRRMLASYLAPHLRRAEFSIDPGGKPFLPGANLHFNISHSVDRIACAICRETQVGVDLERIRLLSASTSDYLTRAFPDFPQQLAELPPDERAREFTRWWTRSEALGKAIGEGIPTGIRAHHQLTHSSPHSVAGPHWQLIDFNPGNDYCGAVAACVQNLSLCITRFAGPFSINSEFNENCKEQSWSA